MDIRFWWHSRFSASPWGRATCSRPTRGQKDYMCVQYEFEGADGKGRNHTSKRTLCVTVQCQNCQSSSYEPMGALGESLRSSRWQGNVFTVWLKKKYRGGYYARTVSSRQWSPFIISVSMCEGVLRMRVDLQVKWKMKETWYCGCYFLTISTN